MSVNISDKIVGNELLKVAGRDGTGIHGSVVHGFGVGQHHYHFLCPLREGSLNRLRHMDLVRPLLGAYRIAVQRIDNWIAPALVRGVAGWQDDNDVAIDGIAFQIALQRGAVNFDALHRYGFRSLHYGRHVGLNLRQHRYRQYKSDR